MDNLDQQYWKGLDELNREPEFEKERHREFAEKLPLANIISEPDLGLSSNRRDFLKFVGFGISAATLAACTRTPIKKAIPLVEKPEDLEPGNANYYATTCGGCNAACGLIVKVRDGRPIKVDGHPDSPTSLGATCAVGQATVLSLYDSGRLIGPAAKGRLIIPTVNGDELAARAAQIDGWDVLDDKVKKGLSSARSIRLVTPTVSSPTTLQAIKEFTARYPSTRHVQYDAISFSGMLAAHNQIFGKAAVPTYSFDKADAVVSFGADFLGTWLSPVEFTRQWISKRNPNNASDYMYHMQFESRLSLTGSKADRRVPMKPSQLRATLQNLHAMIAGNTGNPAAASSSLELAGNAIKEAAQVLFKNRGRSIVITDSNDAADQMLVGAINQMLGNYGNTIDIANPSNQYKAMDSEMLGLVEEMKSGNVDALMLWDVNPAYTLPASLGFAAALNKVKMSVALSLRLDETAVNCTYTAPIHHFLESWGDEVPRNGYVSLRQPTISPILATRSGVESLLTWAGSANADHHDYLAKQYATSGAGAADHMQWWTSTLAQGYIKQNTALGTAPSASIGGAVNLPSVQMAGKGDLELVLYEKVSLMDGRDSNNPWLMELPDPISKVSWDNYAAISPKWADEMGITDEDVVEVSDGKYTVSLPALRQPGQPYGTVSIAYGYGREMHITAGKVANGIGANAYGFVQAGPNALMHGGQKVSVTKTGSTYPLALTQTHFHVEGRGLVKETTVADLGNYAADHGGHHIISLWKDYRYPAQQWGMAIDLNACTGCSACVVACSAENNVAVVGKDEVRKRREMHWLRIDRYYSIADTEKHWIEEYKEVDKLASEDKMDYDNVKVIFQPMLCQHCSNAPCESVCPVNAISHSSDGINQQVYNRCVGTRYCANNCPYKVRRFNWFDYALNDKFDYNMNNGLGRMVLNPDVTVRIRGVMEKCSFCTQRLQAGKLAAKAEMRPLAPNEIKVACQSACPSNAIVFGDMNNPNSDVAKLIKDKRSYTLLDAELNTKPSVHYMSHVRQTPTLA